MTRLVTIGLALLLQAVAYGSTSQFQKPWFCSDNDCPPYNVTEAVGSGQSQYEVRSYEPSQWAATNCTEATRECMRDAFMRLFRYIQGANDRGATIAMTVPVLTATYLNGHMTQLFYMPDAPPVPSDPKVWLVNFPQKDFFVRSWVTVNTKSSDSKYTMEMESLKEALPPQALYDASFYYRAGYHSPWHQGNRQHEVWLAKL